MNVAKILLSLTFAMVMSFAGNRAMAQNNAWVQTNGPLGGTVNVVAVNKSNGYLFAVIEGGGLIRSTNNGEDWTQFNSGLSTQAVQAIVINASGDIFAGTNQGIFRSTDHGATWTQVYTGTATTRNIQVLTINPQTNEIFAGTSSANNGTILRSSDHGATWMQFTSGLAQVGVIQALAVNSSTGDIFIGSSRSGVLRSTDRGATWTAIGASLPYKDVDALIVMSNGDLFIGADSSGIKHGIFRSIDQGANWSLVLKTTSSIGTFAINSHQHIYAGTHSGVYLSTDSGNNWTLKNNGFRSLAILALAINANDHVFAGTHCTGVFRSTDHAASWTEINAALRYMTVEALAVHPTTGHTFAGSHCGGVFRSSDGNNWTWAGLPNQSIAALISHPNGALFAGTQGSDIFGGAGGDIYRSTDNGNTWQHVSPDDDYFLSFAVGPNGEIYAGIGYFQLCGLGFCDYGDIFQSNNNGQSWTRIASKLDDHVQALAVNANGRVVAGTPEGIFRRSGDFWHKVSAANTHSLLYHPASRSFFAGTSGGIFRSTDDAETWNMVNSLPGNFTWSFDIDVNGYIYASTEKSGVLFSIDQGATWQQANTDLTILNVRSLAINDLTQQIFAGTNGGGVFRNALKTGVKETVAEMPLSFALAQNHPNPFNPSTTIIYTLPQAVDVKLEIFDLMGRNVRTLVNQRQQAGRFTITWNGHNEQGQPLASGVYLYQLRAGSFVQKRKMALMR